MPSSSKRRRDGRGPRSHREGGEPEEPEEPVPEAIKSEPSFMQPKSAYDRYRDAQRDRLARQHPELEPMQLNERCG